MNNLELSNAYHRVETKYKVRQYGLTTKLWMKWCLDLIHSDVEKFSQGDLTNLAEELTAFLIFMSDNQETRDTLTVAQLKVAQYHLKYTWDKLIAAKDGVTDLGFFTFQITLRRGVTGTRMVRTFTSLMVEVSFYFAELITEFEGKVKQCPECSTLFIQERIDQIYDKLKCQTTVAQRNFKSKVTA